MGQTLATQKHATDQQVAQMGSVAEEAVSALQSDDSVYLRRRNQ